MGVVEEIAAVKAEHLHQPGANGDDDRDHRDACEAAYGVDEVLLAGAGQDDACEQDHAANPHGHRQCVGNAEQHTEQYEWPVDAADADHGDR